MARRRRRGQARGRRRGRRRRRRRRRGRRGRQPGERRRGPPSLSCSSPNQTYWSNWSVRKRVSELKLAGELVDQVEGQEPGGSNLQNWAFANQLVASTRAKSSKWPSGKPPENFPRYLQNRFLPLKGLHPGWWDEGSLQRKQNPETGKSASTKGQRSH